jgi:hypothetical protein
MIRKCYLFELGFSVVKEENGFWYQRDRDAHKWTENPEWCRRYYDAQYDVIEIEYDEENEKIVSRRRIQGFWSLDDEKLFEFEQGDV